MANIKTILFADETYKSREAIAKLLKENGYEVVVVENGKEALETLNINRVPNMIALSATLTEVDTPHVCEEIRKDTRTRNTPVLIMQEKAVDEMPYRKLQVNEFCSKTLDRSALIDKVNKIVKYGSSQAAPKKDSGEAMKTLALSAIGMVCLVFLFFAIILPIFSADKENPKQSKAKKVVSTSRY